MDNKSQHNNDNLSNTQDSYTILLDHRDGSYHQKSTRAISIFFTNQEKEKTKSKFLNVLHNIFKAVETG